MKIFHRRFVISRKYHRWLLHRRIEKAKRLLALIDAGTKRVGMPKHARKQMWRDFIKSADNHEKIFELIGGIE